MLGADSPVCFRAVIATSTLMSAYNNTSTWERGVVRTDVVATPSDGAPRCTFGGSLPAFYMNSPTGISGNVNTDTIGVCGLGGLPCAIGVGVGSGAIVGELPVEIATRGKVLSGGPRSSVTIAVSSNGIMSRLTPGPTLFVVIRVAPYAVSGETDVDSVPWIAGPLTVTGQVGDFDTYSNFFASAGRRRIFAVPVAGGDADGTWPVTYATRLVSAVASRVPPPLGSYNS